MVGVGLGAERCAAAVIFGEEGEIFVEHCGVGLHKQGCSFTSRLA